MKGFSYLGNVANQHMLYPKCTYPARIQFCRLRESNKMNR